MYLSRRLGRSLAPPDWLSINLTLGCNLHCVVCWTCYPVQNDLSTREILDLARPLARDMAAFLGIQGYGGAAMNQIGVFTLVTQCTSVACFSLP
jgi:MoaA/NifB/PqqE/SkfB family radical SAM enzyme